MNRGFQPVARALTRAFTPRTGWLFLNSPGDPTGAILAPSPRTSTTCAPPTRECIGATVLSATGVQTVTTGIANYGVTNVSYSAFGEATLNVGLAQVPGPLIRAPIAEGTLESVLDES